MSKNINEVISINTEEKDSKNIDESIEENLSICEKDTKNVPIIIGAGKYIFGEDLPVGKYDLKVVRGEQAILETKIGRVKNRYMIGTDKYNISVYRNLKGSEGDWFSINRSVEVEITKSIMLEFD